MITHNPGDMCVKYRYRCHPAENGMPLGMRPERMGTDLNWWQVARRFTILTLGFLVIGSVLLGGESMALLPVGCLLLGLPALMSRDVEEPPHHPSLDRAGARKLPRSEPTRGPRGPAGTSRPPARVDFSMADFRGCAPPLYDQYVAELRHLVLQPHRSPEIIARIDTLGAEIRRIESYRPGPETSPSGWDKAVNGMIAAVTPPWTGPAADLARVEHEAWPDGLGWSEFKHDPRCPTCHGNA